MCYHAYELSNSSIILLVNAHTFCLTLVMFSHFTVMAFPSSREEGCGTDYMSVSEVMFTLERLLLQILSVCNS